MNTTYLITLIVIAILTVAKYIYSIIIVHKIKSLPVSKIKAITESLEKTSGMFDLSKWINAIKSKLKLPNT